MARKIHVATTAAFVAIVLSFHARIIYLLFQLTQPSTIEYYSDYDADLSIPWKTFTCQDLGRQSPTFAGRVVEGTIVGKTLFQDALPYSDSWGNLLHSYWSSRIYAALGGFRYRYLGRRLVEREEWMRYLPTVAEARPPDPLALAKFCLCRRGNQSYADSDVRFTDSDVSFTDNDVSSDVIRKIQSLDCQHGWPNHGWGDIYQTIRNETRAAYDQYLQHHGANLARSSVGPWPPWSVFQPDDWLVYDRCQIFDHPLYGFGSLDTFDAMPEGNFTIYTMADVGRGEHSDLCPTLLRLRDERLRRNNPQAALVTLPTSSKFADFGMLIYAPHVFNPSAASTWAHWSTLSNNGTVLSVPMLGGPFGSMDLTVYPPNFQILNTSVLYPPQSDDKTRKCVGYHKFNASDEKHRQKVIDCFISGLDN